MPNRYPDDWFTILCLLLAIAGFGAALLFLWKIASALF
jgi:hypothetical protein